MAIFQITYEGRACLPLALPKDGRFTVEQSGKTFTNKGRDFVFGKIFESERPVILSIRDYAPENVPAYASGNNDRDCPDGMGRRSA